MDQIESHLAHIKCMLNQYRQKKEFFKNKWCTKPVDLATNVIV